jgi:hypothetical protein
VRIGEHRLFAESFSASDEIANERMIDGRVTASQDSLARLTGCGYTPA